jgi:hypothetical protein
VSVRKMKALPV